MRWLALALFLNFSDAAACPSSIENSTDYSVEGIKFVNVSAVLIARAKQTAYRLATAPHGLALLAAGNTN
jgi:hypothetical protein